MADQPAPTAPGTVYHVGTMPDGRIILSSSGDLPVDDTEVWFEDTPDARMTVVELEDANPVDPGTEIAWAAEPQPHQPDTGAQPRRDDPAQMPEDGVERAEDQAAAPPAQSNPAKEPPMGMAAEMDDKRPKMAAVTINGEAPTGAMIALIPELPETLADPDGDPPEALHVTLKWLGKADLWDDDERQSIEDIVEAWANRSSEAVTATVAGAGKLGGEGAAVLFLEADRLPAMRAELNADLTAAFGPDVEDTHPSFIAHLTTGYGTEPRYDLMGEPVSFREVRVHWGPDTVSFPIDSDIAYLAALGDLDDDSRTDELAEADELSEVEVDRWSDLVDDAEARVAELEGMVAELVMAQVADELFLDDDDADPDPLPKVASLAGVDLSAYSAALARFHAETRPKLAALSDDLPDDLSGRVDALVERLEALEGSVGEMLLAGVADEQMPELPPGSGTFVDETNPNRPGAPDQDDDDPDGEDEAQDDPDPDPDDDETYDEDADEAPWSKKKKRKKA